jgi:hypothetical protein
MSHHVAPAALLAKKGAVHCWNMAILPDRILSNSKSIGKLAAPKFMVAAPAESVRRGRTAAARKRAKGNLQFGPVRIVNRGTSVRVEDRLSICLWLLTSRRSATNW